ncbi:MAG TPA: hypothetical protein VJ781_08540 [Pyrinomonadaceae bacterium]|jgi:hypothetical protein|nr:hypothetical protein [Pyrinomonadaceae bacterium]
MNPQETNIQGILAEYLNSRNPSNAPTGHLDQDTLAAFTEGTLTELQATPAVSHLVDCSYCRHITAELVRLDLEFAEEPVPARTRDAEPARISEVLSGVLAKIFGTSENAVFAHEDKDKKDEKDKDQIDEKKD